MDGDDLTMGSAPARRQDSGRPAGAARRDTGRRMSSWLQTKKADDPGTQ
jgi:hypothetical protein